uniref:Uncharacterized protein n=1 Tax=Pipistrellus kuhlii TaxID=59472 RepID=A0A7J7XUW7_PIPKU|nr:hypothetical protein mPipKuh1_010447 [Pipistrellus kuhlii]
MPHEPMHAKSPVETGNALSTLSQPSSDTGANVRGLCFRRRLNFLRPLQEVAETPRVCMHQGELISPSGSKRFCVFPHTCCLLSQTSSFLKNPNFVPRQHPLLVLASSFRCSSTFCAPEYAFFLGTNFSCLKSWNNGLVLTPSHQHIPLKQSEV